MKKLLVVFAISRQSSAFARRFHRTHHGQEVLHQESDGGQRSLRQALHRAVVRPAVLATEDGKIYKIADQDKVKRARRPQSHHHRQVDGDTITVESVKM